MKYRQAKKICKRLGLCSIGYNSPTINKAIVVYIHHTKKNHSKYERFGYIKELRSFYEKSHKKAL